MVFKCDTLGNFELDWAPFLPRKIHIYVLHSIIPQSLARKLFSFHHSSQGLRNIPFYPKTINRLENGLSIKTRKPFGPS